MRNKMGNEKIILEKQATKAIAALNKSIKKVFGLENLAQVGYQIAAIEGIFRSGYNLEPCDVNSNTINNLNKDVRSSAREYWAKYVTLKYFWETGQQHILYKSIVLKKIPDGGIEWKSKN